MVIRSLLVVGVVLVGGFVALVTVVVQAASAGASQNLGCSAPVGVVAPVASPSLQGTTTPTPTQSSTNDGETYCYPTSASGAAVVSWAKRMADTLYVNPACGARRGGSCNDTWYTSAFPAEVLRYGQQWCQAHGDCSDWANGSYQCVSFVRGAYSQVSPMNVTNDAFGLWESYQHVPGWQEIPAAATTDPAQRFLPEPGDIMVFKNNGVGHVSIVMSVQPPNGQTNGWITFANANSSSAYDRMPLLPNLLVDTSEWDPSGEAFTVWGYIRPLPVAARNVVRISQLDHAQYASDEEWNTWAYSACSAAAMTEVLNAYDRPVHIHDVLAVESARDDIDPVNGLTHDGGIEDTMAQFGFKTTWGDHWTIAQVVGAANGGAPVIVGWPPDRYAGGHIVVVTGGDLQAGTITLADSSLWNRQSVSVNQFMQWWAGFAAVATPA